MGEDCKEELTEFAEVRTTVEVAKMLECPVHASWELKREVTVERKGRALNGFELRESLPDFLIESAMQVLKEACGYSRLLASDLLATAAEEAKHM